MEKAIADAARHASDALLVADPSSRDTNRRIPCLHCIISGRLSFKGRSLFGPFTAPCHMAHIGVRDEPCDHDHPTAVKNFAQSDLQADRGRRKKPMSLVQSASKAAMAVWATAALLHIEGARAEMPVSIELVLAVDTSISVDGFEFHLMMKGIANAFRRPEIIDLIGHQNGVAVALFQWNSQVNEQYIIPWHLLNDPASILSFAAKVEKAERDPNRGFTAIGGAIDFGVRLITENAFDGRQLKIDISGDGRNNAGVPPSIARQEAGCLGIVINGLPILTYTNPAEKIDLDAYYREEVIYGPGAFIEIADEFENFARAFLRKLQREITPVVSQENAAPRALIQKTRAGQKNLRIGSICNMRAG